MAKDDDDLYDELYGDDDDEAMPIPAAPPRSPRDSRSPRRTPPRWRFPPAAAPAAPNADDDSDDDFDIALNEPDVGDPDDPDDFKIVLDDTEQLYGTGHTAEPYAEEAPEGDAADLAGMDGMPGAASDAPTDPRRAAQAPHDIHYRSKTYVREGAAPGRPPPPAPPPGMPTNLAAARAGPPPPAPPPGRPSFAPPVGVPRDSAMAGGAGRPPPPAPPPGAPSVPKYRGPPVNPPRRCARTAANGTRTIASRPTRDSTNRASASTRRRRRRAVHSPDEYKEFLQLGHGGVFDLDSTTSTSRRGASPARISPRISTTA